MTLKFFSNITNTLYLLYCSATGYPVSTQSCSATTSPLEQKPEPIPETLGYLSIIPKISNITPKEICAGKYDAQNHSASIAIKFHDTVQAAKIHIAETSLIALPFIATCNMSHAEYRKKRKHRQFKLSKAINSISGKLTFPEIRAIFDPIEFLPLNTLPTSTP